MRSHVQGDHRKQHFTEDTEGQRTETQKTLHGCLPAENFQAFLSFNSLLFVANPGWCFSRDRERHGVEVQEGRKVLDWRHPLADGVHFCQKTLSAAHQMPAQRDARTENFTPPTGRRVHLRARNVADTTLGRCANFGGRICARPAPPTPQHPPHSPDPWLHSSSTS